MRTVVFTSDKGNWLLSGFFHQWEKYDGRPIEVMGFTDPGPAVRGGHKFISMGPFEHYPAQHWSNAVMEYLETLSDSHVEIYLEDYWLIRPSNLGLIETAHRFMLDHPEGLRFDLTTDRLYCTNPYPEAVKAIGSFDVIECKGMYSMSFQVNIWNRKLLLEMLCPQESPWEAEIRGSNRVNLSTCRVFGSRQAPVWYSIVVNKGKFDQQGQWMYPQRTLYPEDWKELEELGYTHP